MVLLYVIPNSCICLPISINAQINMKGLDGIQGPIYVGTGCVFRRQALYGYDAPVKKKAVGKTCNCLPKWFCCCCGSRKKTKKGKSKEKDMKSREPSTHLPALKNIEEGIEGKEFNYCNSVNVNPKFLFVSK